MGKDDPDRERRLADALRANLRRRKAQGRRSDAAPSAAVTDRSAEEQDGS